jgi:hypothetical protein
VNDDEYLEERLMESADLVLVLRNEKPKREPSNAHDAALVARLFGSINVFKVLPLAAKIAIWRMEREADERERVLAAVEEYLDGWHNDASRDPKWQELSDKLRGG